MEAPRFLRVNLIRIRQTGELTISSERSLENRPWDGKSIDKTLFWYLFDVSRGLRALRALKVL